MTSFMGKSAVIRYPFDKITANGGDGHVSERESVALIREKPMYRKSLAATLAVTLLALSGAGNEATGQEPRSGTVTGEVKVKKDINDGKNTAIDVLAPGEERARSYHVQYDEKAKGPVPAVLKAVRGAEVGDRVEIEWVATGHGPAIKKLQIVKKRSGEKKDEARKGSVTGVVTAKGDNWLEVKADGEERARRYVPHWRGGAPDQGGGPDKEIVAEIKKVPLNGRVKLDWVFEERPRVEKIEVLKKPEENASDKKK
jgi:hypothetical protein